MIGSIRDELEKLRAVVRACEWWVICDPENASSTVRTDYDAAVAVALMAVAAIVCGLVAAIITGGSPPNFPVVTIAFVQGYVIPYRFASNN